MAVNAEINWLFFSLSIESPFFLDPLEKLVAILFIADRQDHNFSLADSIISPEISASEPIERWRKSSEPLDSGFTDGKGIGLKVRGYVSARQERKRRL
ncbi:MAG TPA: hypothetical protein VMW46_05855 [Candidatus Desulfaltia sp.]|nr:hypothetical protein [Candidatus Desulfaltia sp.]